MKNSGLTWTPANMSRFIAAPSDVVPGTHMTFTGLPKAQDRADVIAYLAQYGPDGQMHK
jgi:cytochrome c